MTTWTFSKTLHGCSTHKVHGERKRRREGETEGGRERRREGERGGKERERRKERERQQETNK